MCYTIIHDFYTDSIFKYDHYLIQMNNYDEQLGSYNKYEQDDSEEEVNSYDNNNPYQEEDQLPTTGADIYSMAIGNNAYQNEYEEANYDYNIDVSKVKKINKDEAKNKIKEALAKFA